MNYSPKLKVDLPKDAPDWAHSFLTQMHGELKNVAIAQKRGGTTVIISSGNTVTSSGGSSGGGSTTSNNVKAGTGTVTASTSAWIAFPTAFTIAPIVTFCAVAGTDGSFGLVNTQNLSVSTTGFGIPSSEIMISGNVFYIAVSA